MMRRLPLIVCLAAIVGLGIVRAEQELTIPELKQPLQLDGGLDDPGWQEGVTVKNFFLRGSEEPAEGTTLVLLHDRTWLYIAARCANANMAHVEQLTYEHDGAVHTDDSLEFFIRPSTEDGADYYHFLVNFAGVMAEQRCNKQGLRDRGWNPPWRAVVRRQADGWTAEIAIPLYCLGAEDMGKLSLNVARTLAQVELDEYGAKRNQIHVSSAIKHGQSGSFHNFANFLLVGGLGGFKPEVPFVPQITRAALDGLRQEGGGNVYDLKITVVPATAVGGRARLAICEDFGKGEQESHAQELKIAGAADLTVTVPAGDLRERAIRVVLTDVAGGNLLATALVRDTSALKVLKDVYAGRSYYSAEEQAEIRVELGLPRKLLAEAELTVETGGKKLLELKGLTSVMTPGFPVSALAEGENEAQVRVLLNGRELAARNVTLVRLAPRPGYEAKADFIQGVILKDGAPIFPMGIVGHSLQMRLGITEGREDDEYMFKFLAEDIGLNCLIRSKVATNTVAFMKLAEKYGLNVITWTSPQPAPIGWTRGTTWSPESGSTMSLSERLAIHKKWYEKLEPGLIEDTKILKDFQNLIGYWNVDEPNLVNPDERIAAAEWYWKTVYALDPYRPQFLLYARHIPHGDNWTRWADSLGYDVYPGAYKGGMYNASGWGTAYYAWQLRERCRQDHKIMFFVPLANTMDPARSPIGLSKQHMLCQAYAAIIYGARGLLYFALNNVVGVDAWDALRIISAQVKEMTPALVNGDVAQNVKYTPDNFEPRSQKFPMVNAAVFRYPDGEYLLLAVNIMPFAADTKFHVAGLRSARALFDADGAKITRGFLSRAGKLSVSAAAFSEKIEPYGVRAYRLELSASSEPAAVAVENAPRESEQAVHVDIRGIMRQLTMSKNHMPNPCFEQQTNPGVPDFYRPYFCLSVDPYWGQKGRSDWFVDNEVLWNGRPSLRMFKRGIRDGGYKTRGLFGGFYPPVSKERRRMTFSFYAKSDNPKASIWIQMTGKPVTISKLSAEWQRHHFTFDLPPGSEANMCRTFLLVPSEGSAIWISGLQVEQGEEPTEFQDDSVLLKKK